MLDVTVAAAPHRDRESLRRGVFHNSKRLDDGTWTWRYDSMRKGEGFVGLWDDVAALTAPTTLVRGGNSVFVADEDADEFARTAPGFRGARVVENSGHSVQNDQPRVLVDILRKVLGGRDSPRTHLSVATICQYLRRCRSKVGKVAYGGHCARPDDPRHWSSLVACRSPAASPAVVGFRQTRPPSPRPASCRKESAAMALVPLNLFVTHRGKSSRQHVTCRYKCGDACSKPAPNTSDNEYFGDIARQAISRRSALQAAGITVLAVSAGSALAACSRDEAPLAVPASPEPAEPPPGMNFQTVAPNIEDAVVIPEGYQQAVVIGWGDPVLPGAPPFDVKAQTGTAQRQQFGFNNDFAALLPIEGQANRFLLVTNHEYVTPQFMFPGYNADAPTRDQFNITIAALGMSVVEVERAPEGGLRPVMGRYNRRITADTPFTLTGPGAGTDFVKTPADPTGRTIAGTFANCAGGVTPWGTVLSGEENFNQYFGAPEGAPGPNPVDADRLDRYGIALEPGELKWETFDPRFDVATTPNEVNRFGYVIEVNPWDPNSTPVKHSALGRLKHEGANVYITGDGTVVVYTGDDERFDYMYKFVSSKKMQPGRDPAAMANNMTLLDEGTLYVAKLSSDVPANEIDGSGKLPSKGSFSGTGTWIPLLRSGPNGQAESLVDGITPQEAAVFTRFAADKAGATKMDRPEDFEANPKTGKVYVALTNNDERGAPGEAPVDAANPRNDNKSGQIMEITDDHAGTSFTWELLMVCGDPEAADTYFAGFDKSKVSPISCPDNLAFDSHGNLWISTDGNALDSNDGLFAVALEGPNRGETRQFLTVPLGAETCGPVITDDLVTVSVQHPGEHDDNSIDDPLSRWPEGGNGTARPSVVAVWKSGGQIGA